MSSCSSGETLFATPRQGKCLRQRETDEGTSCYHHEVPGLPDCSDEGTVLWKISHIFFVKVDSELNVNSRPFHWSCVFACCYLGRSHPADNRVRILLAMETFKSLRTQDKGERLQRQRACSATCLRISICEWVPSTTCSLFFNRLCRCQA